MDRIGRGLSHVKQEKVKSMISPPVRGQGRDGDMAMYNGHLFIKDKNEWHEFVPKPYVANKTSNIDIWQQPTLLNSWANYSDVYSPASYLRDNNNRVYLKGLIRNGTLPSIAFVLPPQYRPIKQINVSALAAAGGTLGTNHLHIYSSGNVKILQASGGGNLYCSLDGISFYVNQ